MKVSARTPVAAKSPAAQSNRGVVRALLYALVLGAVVAGFFLGTAPGEAGAAPTGITTTDCADVEVVFARGTFEGPGVGKVGQPFVDALQQRLPDRTVNVYAVSYPASLDFARAADGVLDASNRVRFLAANCPSTDIVLGGYSQGAAVSGYVASETVPADYALPAGLTGPLPPAVADRVAAVALFGKPSAGILGLLHRGAPPIAVGAAFAGKTIDLCAAQDPVCETGSLDRAAHSAYTTNGMTQQAADFVVSRLPNR
ncbi:cutinase family protein [Mycolicibacterium sp. S2-37]|uniref:cutinase family protein n=1 Tax=Mycolicibacterium sp. S2-37 TaxID=2810297 RepID=UPI001A952FDB|nr:cutinase family protein [Mycolicibacterium sp. S2-37]MBO0681097.1 cutinase family protein [Mycolicibacterium sp. S2-37]